MCATSDELTDIARNVKKDLTEVKNLLVSRQQPYEFSAFNSTSVLCECKIYSLFTRDSRYCYSAKI